MKRDERKAVFTDIVEVFDDHLLKLHLFFIGEVDVVPFDETVKGALLAHPAFCVPKMFVEDRDARAKGLLIARKEGVIFEKFTRYFRDKFAVAYVQFGAPFLFPQFSNGFSNRCRCIKV